MLKLSIFFYVLGLIFLLVGANEITSMTFETGKVLFLAFTILSTVAFFSSMVKTKKRY